jgi:hypothetical protein
VTGLALARAQPPQTTTTTKQAKKKKKLQKPAKTQNLKLGNVRKAAGEKSGHYAPFLLE